MTVAIVREQRRALRVSGGCGMQSAELFSKLHPTLHGKPGGLARTAMQADRAKFNSFLY